MKVQAKSQKGKIPCLVPEKRENQIKYKQLLHEAVFCVNLKKIILKML